MFLLWNGASLFYGPWFYIFNSWVNKFRQFLLTTSVIRFSDALNSGFLQESESSSPCMAFICRRIFAYCRCSPLRMGMSIQRLTSGEGGFYPGTVFHFGSKFTSLVVSFIHIVQVLIQLAFASISTRCGSCIQLRKRASQFEFKFEIVVSWLSYLRRAYYSETCWVLSFQSHQAN